MLSQGIVLYPLVLFAFGACMGSFLNVVICRLPQGVSMVYPGSMCPGCGRELNVLENIPILSWVIQRGKCKGCGAKIHWRYPGVELLTGLIWAAVGFVYADMPGDAVTRVATYTALIWFVTWLIPISFIDYDLTIIPDELNYSGIGISALASYFLPSLHQEAAQWYPAVNNLGIKSLLAGGLGLLAGAGAMLAVLLIGTIAYRHKIKELQKDDPEITTAIGFGDVKLMAFLGCFLGWQDVLLAFLIGTIFGAVVGIAAKLKNGSSLMPYGPALCAGALVMVLFKPQVHEFISTFVFHQNTAAM